MPNIWLLERALCPPFLILISILQSSEDLYAALETYNRQLQGLKSLHQPGPENALILVGQASAT